MNTGAEKMRYLFERVKGKLPPGLGAILLVFEHNNPDKGMANYISDSIRADTIKFLRETADRLERNQDFKTPESN